METIRLSIVKKRDSVSKKLSAHVRTLCKGKNPMHEITLLEVHTANTPEGTRKFICGYQGNIWEVWQEESGKFGPPVLTEGELPIVAQVYFEWRLGSVRETHVTQWVRSGQQNPIHGEICWCYVYSGENQETAKFYSKDGFFYPNGFAWFPEVETKHKK